MRIYICFILGVLASNTIYAAPLSLSDALKQGLTNSSELAAQSAKLAAEQESIAPMQVLADPKIGIMQESKDNDSMQTFMVSQEFTLPQKYQTASRINQFKSEKTKLQIIMQKFAVRKQILSTYINAQLTQEMIQTLNAQKELLREIARIAEFRYATNNASQQDQMKVHVEQVKTENELLTMEQDKKSMLIMLQSLLNNKEEPKLQKWDKKLIPQFTIKSPEEIDSLIINSVQLSEQELMKQESEQMKSMAELEYAPDFMISYYKPLNSSKNNDYSIALEMTLPIWFYKKQDPQIKSSQQKIIEATYNIDSRKRSLLSESRILYSKITTAQRQLNYYDNSLLPLVNNALNTSRNNYKSGQGSFMELLESERMLFDTQLNYLRTIGIYIDLILDLEMVLNTNISSLPQ